ncbi:MAG: peptide/nickel transport system permease protein [Solirubrobacteraceae bacterium]|nr:peptide/nickel transport system permease protein [Solirubrobacteraceae bacterium]
MRGSGILRFALWRTLGLVVVLIALTFVVFVLRSVIPIDPARVAAGPNAPAAQVEAFRVRLGLDKPILVQYEHYLGDLAHGNLGTSPITHNPVRTDIGQFLPASVELIAYALVLALGLALILALGQTLLPHSAWLRVLLVGGASAPIFLTGLLALYFLWYKLHWFPNGGRTNISDAPTGSTRFLTIDGLVAGRPGVTINALWHIFLPALCLAIPPGVAIGRQLRSALHNVLREDYARTARSKGLTEAQVVRRHGLRNAASAALSMTGLQIGMLFATILIVEPIFSWPGLGLYTVQALGQSDLTAVLGVAVIFGAAYVIINALIDVGQVLLDPRITLD